MNQINQIFNSSELALAAYADLLSGVTNQAGNVSPLFAADTMPTQLDRFASRYPTVVAYYSDASGLSATNLCHTNRADFRRDGRQSRSTHCGAVCV